MRMKPSVTSFQMITHPGDSPLMLKPMSFAFYRKGCLNSRHLSDKIMKCVLQRYECEVIRVMERLGFYISVALLFMMEFQPFKRKKEVDSDEEVEPQDQIAQKNTNTDSPSP